MALLLIVFGAGAFILPPSLAGGKETAASASDSDHELAAAPATASDTPTTPAPVDGVATMGEGEAVEETPSPSPPAKTSKAASKPKAASNSSGTSTKAATGNTALEDQVAAITDTERAKAGCGKLRIDAKLRTAARAHSQDMADQNYFSHTGQDGSTPWDRAEAAGYSQPIGENIAKGQRTPADVMDAWMNSEGHRANIENCDAKAIGVGLAYDGSTPIWTQMFGAV